MIPSALGFAQSGSRRESERSAKNEERTCRDQGKSDRMIPGDRFLEIKDREACEYKERDDLLHGLKLRRRIDRVAPAVRRYRQAIFDERDAPGRENHARQRHLL